MNKMKKTLFLLAFTPVVLMAQNFNYITQQHFVDTVDDENYEMYDAQFTTPTPEAITFEWESVMNTFPADWSYSFCDQGGCYVGLPASGTMTAITLADAQSGTVGFLKLNLTTGSTYGQGLIKIYVYDSNDYSRGDTVTFNITHLAPSSVEEVAWQTKVYPNPVVSELHWEGDNPQSIQVYNSNGQMCLNASPKKASLSLEKLPKGIYTIQFEFEEGVRSEKIMKL
jgi:hypothetical protein